MLTRQQKKYLREIKENFNRKEDSGLFNNEEYVKYQDVLHLLEQRNIIMNTHIMGGYLYSQTAPFDIFDTWLKDVEKEERRLSFREWKIAIIGGLAGSIVSWLLSWWL